MSVTIGTLLAAYEADREPVVIAQQRLRSTVRRLSQSTGDREVTDQASIVARGARGNAG